MALKHTSEGVILPASFDPLNISKRFWKKVNFSLRDREMMGPSTHTFVFFSERGGREL